MFQFFTPSGQSGARRAQQSWPMHSKDDYTAGEMFSSCSSCQIEATGATFHFSCANIWEHTHKHFLQNISGLIA